MSGYDDMLDRYRDWWDEEGDARFEGKMFAALPEELEEE